MKVSRLDFPIQGENTVKRILLAVAAALMFVSTLVIPTVVHADGTPIATSCGGNTMCKP
jgi:hypothetical protein